MDEARMQTFARSYTAAWCSQDPLQVAAHYAVHGSLRINQGEVQVGREAIAEAARSFMTAFPDMQVLLDEVRQHDGRIRYHWTLTGTNNGPGGTGRAVRINGYEEWLMADDGLIASSLGHFDEALYQSQIEGST